MKNLSLISIFLLFLIEISTAGDIAVIKSGGGPNGYNYINEQHGDGVSTLTCDQPGYETCKFTVKPYVVANDDIYFVDIQIESGLFTGTAILSGPTRTVSWSGTNINNVTISISIP